MLLAGTNIVSSADKLCKIKVEQLYHRLRNPNPDIESRVRQLRVVRNLDKKQYTSLKKELPYVVCGIFNPTFRRTENFAFIEYFIIDIDNLTEKGISIHDTKIRLIKDERVIMCFVSPSEDGLKVLFRLKERCYDPGIYSLFYKAFIKSFSSQYHLEQVVDGKTCDVCRACFISVDSEAYYNPDATLIDLNSYLELSNTVAMFDLKNTLEKEIKEVKTDKEPRNVDPEKDIIDKIRSTLNPKAKIKEKTPVYIPHQLEEVIIGLSEYANDHGVELYEVINIQYGKKLRFRMGIREAEINLFFGKRGFSVVQSPRCGTSAEFNSLMADVVESFLSECI